MWKMWNKRENVRWAAQVLPCTGSFPDVNTVNKPCHKGCDPQGWSSSIQLSEALHLKHESRVISNNILTFANISYEKKMHALFIINTDNLKNLIYNISYVLNTYQALLE